MTAAATTTAYLCGIEADQVHAVAGVETQRAVCGALTRLASKWGSYRDGLPASLALTGHLCPTCAWKVALERGTTAAELEHWITCGATGPAGDLAAQAAQAVLDRIATDREDTDAPAEVRLLVTISRHWPVQLLQEDCAEDECDHDNAEECASLAGSVACPACSVLTGPEAGEWEGQYEVPVTAPCSALTAIAAHVGVSEVAS
jgi:hypothetical protein